MTTAADRVMTYSILALLVWVALPVGSNRPWSAMLFVLLVALLAALWAVFNLRAKKLRHSQTLVLKKARWPLILLFFCQCWVAIQWLFGFSQHSDQTFYYLLLGVAYSLLYLLIVANFTTRSKLTLLLATLILSGTLQGFYGAFLTLSGVEWRLFAAEPSGGHATGTFVNRNHFAGYLNMTIACGIGLLLALRTDEPISVRNIIDILIGPKAKIRLALVIMVIALVMSHSRMGNTAFFISLILAGSFFIVRNKANRLRNSLVLVSIIIIDVLVISQYFGLERLKDRLLATDIASTVIQIDAASSVNTAEDSAITSINTQPDGNRGLVMPIISGAGEEKIVIDVVSELRDEVIMSALPLLYQRPFIGHGAGSFEAVYQPYPDDVIRLHFDHAHNDYLQFLVEFGIIGTAPLALFVLMSLGYAMQSFWMRRSRYRSGVGFAALMAIMVILIHSFTDFNLQIPANAAIFVALCAIAVLAKHHTREYKETKKAKTLFSDSVLIAEKPFVGQSQTRL